MSLREARRDLKRVLRPGQKAALCVAAPWRSSPRLHSALFCRHARAKLGARDADGPVVHQWGDRTLRATATGLTRDVRSLATDLARVSQSVEPISGDAVTLAGDLSAINEDLRGFAPILDGYIAMIEDIREGLAQARASLPRLVWIAKLAIAILAGWLGTLHLAPLVLGWDLVAKKRPGEAAIQRISDPPSAPDLEEDGSDS